jgi:hypothetical protein
MRESGRVGDWRMQATAVLQREKHRPRLLAFLFPPQSFAGSARLSVITADRRDEFAHAWTSEDSTPLLFSIPVGDPAAEAIARADLLLEIAAKNRAPQLVTGAVAFRAPRETARIYLAPVLLGGGREVAGDPDADAWLDVLARDAELRLAVDAGRLEALPDDPARAKARTLVGTGRLEIVDAAGVAPSTPLPFPLRTRVTTEPPRADLAGLPDGVRTLLLLGADAAAWAAALHPVLREFPFRILAPTRSALACVVPALCVLDPHVRANGARAAAALDRMLLALPSAAPDAAATVAPRRSAPALRAPGFCVLPLESAPELHALAGFVREWNRRHTTPDLDLVTPADYFALLEELEAHGAIAVPQIQLP